MHKLIILNECPDSCKDKIITRTKSFVRKHFLHYGGPQSVVDSLLPGLDEMGVNYKYNPIPSEINKDSIVCVLSNIKALRWGLQAKDRKQIGRLIVGPNLFSAPNDYDFGAADKRIDALIFPSQWVVDLFVHYIPEIKDRAFVWWAPVEIPEANQAGRDSILVYRKRCPEELYCDIISFLKEKNIKFFEIKYGHYKKSDYHKLLKRARLAIFLQESETQGLALCEAWARDVPTFVWDRGYWEYKGFKWVDSKISAPYLSDLSGWFFCDFIEFKEKFEDFLNFHSFSARNYAVGKFSAKKCANYFLKIVFEGDRSGK